MKQLIFKAICGSIAQGTDSPSSDRDEKHIYITDEFDVIKDYESQTEHWELNKFFSVCAKGIPFELETLYAPKRCWLTMLPLQFQSLIDQRIFVTQDTIKMYFYCAEWKQRQSGNQSNKLSMHSIRYLLEIKHMLNSNDGPRIEVGSDRDMLTQIKYGRMDVDIMKEIYHSLWMETKQLPVSHLPLKADADAIEKATQEILHSYISR